MPIFKNPQGQTVTSQEALIDGAKLRPGYYQVLVEGDRIGFDISMLDSKATPGSTFLTDEISAAVSQARKAHYEKFAFMGDRAPRFDEARATFLAQCNAASSAMGGAAVRDAARMERNLPSRGNALDNSSVGTADHRAVAAMRRWSRAAGY